MPHRLDPNAFHTKNEDAGADGRFVVASGLCGAERLLMFFWFGVVLFIDPLSLMGDPIASPLLENQTACDKTSVLTRLSYL